ncbi:hypothetical protein [Evansella tamaricis]|uniref:Uncharacterized protein n=1 Tax=Evansella tamaricis TaxID=2069301 RepID=A0ABS6JMK9_9BACI|nr:hypothetical protein [Evansella tamaricis]MBU9714906.1 hypothetical protein [Evansella tamaricis]
MKHKQQDPLEKERFLRSKLDEYHVDVPDFPMKSEKTKGDRLIAFLASPTENPLEKLILTVNGVTMLKLAPIGLVMGLTILQFLIFF